MNDNMTSERVSLAEARPSIGRIARAASSERKRTALTDHGQVIAVVISPSELEELEDQNAAMRHRLNVIDGTAGQPIPHDQFVRETKELTAQDEELGVEK